MAIKRYNGLIHIEGEDGLTLSAPTLHTVVLASDYDRAAALLRRAREKIVEAWGVMPQDADELLYAIDNELEGT